MCSSDLNYNKKAQIEAGFTLQSSLHAEAVDYIDGLESERKFLRTPNEYGYLVLMLNPTSRISISANGLYTGTMLQAKYSPDETLAPNEYRTAPSYAEIGLKLGYTFPVKSIDTGIEIYGGVKNLGNVYQKDFDNYRNRDSDYIYGPSLPRTIYIGIKLKTI